MGNESVNMPVAQAAVGAGGAQVSTQTHTEDPLFSGLRKDVTGIASQTAQRVPDQLMLFLASPLMTHMNAQQLSAGYSNVPQFQAMIPVTSFPPPGVGLHTKLSAAAPTGMGAGTWVVPSPWQGAQVFNAPPAASAATVTASPPSGAYNHQAAQAHLGGSIASVNSVESPYSQVISLAKQLSELLLQSDLLQPKTPENFANVPRYAVNVSAQNNGAAAPTSAPPAPPPRHPAPKLTQQQSTEKRANSLPVQPQKTPKKPKRQAPPPPSAAKLPQQQRTEQQAGFDPRAQRARLKKTGNLEKLLAKDQAGREGSVVRAPDADRGRWEEPHWDEHLTMREAGQLLEQSSRDYDSV
ncbi:MAG: hypothetical protein OXC07_01730, partial [Kistimonas sp.]|nr:hypothetical protein [Kistimonas sp.]